VSLVEDAATIAGHLAQLIVNHHEPNSGTSLDGLELTAAEHRQLREFFSRRRDMRRRVLRNLNRARVAQNSKNAGS
jgi:hypothetical protein